MTQIYSDPDRENSRWSLPDVEVFYAREGELEMFNLPDEPSEAGWYFWACFPGCLPEGDPIGPFKKELDAINGAQEWFAAE